MKVVVWSKYDCSFCDQAKELLRQNEITFEERKIGDGYTKEDLLEAVPSARTLPQIFLNGQHVGGYNELRKYLEESISNYGDGQL